MIEWRVRLLTTQTLPMTMTVSSNPQNPSHRWACYIEPAPSGYMDFQSLRRFKKHYVLIRQKFKRKMVWPVLDGSRHLPFLRWVRWKAEAHRISALPFGPIFCSPGRRIKPCRRKANIEMFRELFFSLWPIIASNFCCASFDFRGARSSQSTLSRPLSDYWYTKIICIRLLEIFAGIPIKKSEKVC